MGKPTTLKVRDTRSGRFVRKGEAKRRPATTVTERMPLTERSPIYRVSTALILHVLGLATLAATIEKTSHMSAPELKRLQRQARRVLKLLDTDRKAARK